MAKALQYGEAAKRPVNFSIIEEKLRNGSPFKMLDGSVVTFVTPDEPVLKAIGKGDHLAYTKSKLLASNGKIYTLSKVEKTAEFGGKATDGTHFETQEIKSLNDQLDAIKKEIGAGLVPIRVGNKVYNVYEVKKTPGTPKSDFNFCDHDGKPVIHLSHKKGTSPKHFQQWGGVTDRAGTAIAKHPEVLDFVKTLKAIVGPEIPKGSAFFRKLKTGSTLGLMSVYGQSYKSPDLKNPDNVRIVVQGTVKITKDGDAFEVKSNHVMKNPEYPKDPYMTILMATHKGDNRSSGGIKNCRIGVYPKKDRVAQEI